MADIEVPLPGASDIVGRLLSDALSEHPDVQWLGLVSEDGFAIASEGDVSVDDDAVAVGAVRMMIQMRTMSSALGQSGTSQMFLEGSESGICVIDKDPWVLVVVGAPGVPIGLLRYEARDIAEAFPMGRRRALTAAGEPSEPEPEPAADWSMAGANSFSTGEFDEQVDAASDFGDVGEVPDVGLAFPTVGADDYIVTEPDGEPEIRWADEPTISEVSFGDDYLTAESEQPQTGAFAMPEVQVEVETEVDSGDFSDWLTPTESDPSAEDVFDLPPPLTETAVSFEAPGLIDDALLGAVDDLSDLAPPSGDPIDLPPPMGPAFELPPPE